MTRRPKYTYYSYTENNRYRGSKSKCSAKKRDDDNYEIIKNDAYKLCYDMKKLFNKKKRIVFKKSKYQAYTNNEKVVKFIFLGVISFMLMSLVITFPGAFLVCLIGYLLYSCK